MKKIIIFIFVAVFIVTNAQAQEAKKAVALIKGTTEDSSINGRVDLVELPEGGVRVEAKLNNVPGPGNHGFHIHEKGSCDNAGAAAGGHFNPHQMIHGNRPMTDQAHPGDMGNIVVANDGQASLAVVLPDVSLSKGDFNIAGLAIILHEKEDDFSQPTGNAGGRIGCGIIEVEK